MKLALLNQSAAPPDAMAKIAAALDVYLNRDVCPAWERAPVSVTWMPGLAVAPDGFMALVAFDKPDEDGVEGYHATDPRGVPYGRAFLDMIPAKELLRDQHGRGASLAGVLMHESGELAMDMFAGFWSDGPVHDAAGASFPQVALEIADPVQDSAYAITLPDGTLVDASNFVLPAYFNAEATAGPFDQMQLLTRPLTIARGGYVIARQGGEESQLTARRIVHEEPPAAWRDSMKAGCHSRSFRRLNGG